MTAIQMRGDKVTAAKTRAAVFVDRQGCRPTAAVVRVGDDPGTAHYSRALARTFESVGVAFPS